MPPRYAYWTILAGGLPTAFRATEREDLMPTFNRLRERHPDAQLKYFARGRLWNSREEAQKAFEERTTRPPRGRDWRPGGEHRDPRQRFDDERKAKNRARRQERFDHKQRRDDVKRRPPTEPSSAPPKPLVTARTRPTESRPPAAGDRRPLPPKRPATPHQRPNDDRFPRPTSNERSWSPKNTDRPPGPKGAGKFPRPSGSRAGGAGRPSGRYGGKPTGRPPGKPPGKPPGRGGRGRR